MRLTTNSTCEKNLILNSFVENVRIDGRRIDEYRPLQIKLGRKNGSCFVELGLTKIFVTVAAELVTPKQSRPHTGVLQINLDMSPMAAPNFEAGRLGEKGIEILRLLERTLKETLCLDLESLCVIAGEKVWEIRVDVHVLDHDGSIIDCASVAVICALKSFRRPDVTICGENYFVHDPSQKEPVPLNVLHIPICLTFGLTEEGNCITVDPCEREQQAFDGEVVVATNSHKEICAIHCKGSSLLKKAQVLKCVSMATQRAVYVDQLIKDIFAEDALHRSKKTKDGFWTLARPYSVLYAKREKENLTADVTAAGEDEMDVEIKTDIVHQAEETNNLLSKKKKGKIVQSIKQSNTLMTQKQFVANEEDTAIVEEILKVRIDAGGENNDSKNAHENDISIVAVKKPSVMKARRKERLRKKDSDFLPMKCDACSQIFCCDHIKYDVHFCSSSYKKDVQVPVCPLCNKPVPTARDELPDVKVGEHIDRDCQSDPAKAKRAVDSHRCSVIRCKKSEFIPVVCKSCRRNYCLSHRNPLDHDCKRVSREPISASTSSKRAEAMSEDEALARALQLSLNGSTSRADIELSQEELDRRLAEALSRGEENFVAEQIRQQENQKKSCAIS